MQSRGLHALLERHPIAGGESHSWLVTVMAFAGGAFLAGSWVAAFTAFAAVRLAQSLLRGDHWRGGGPAMLA